MLLKSTHPSVKINTEKDRIIWDNLMDLAIKKHGFTKDNELAKFLGMAAQQLGQIKKSTRGIGKINIKRICDKMGVTEEWLLTKHSKGGKPENDMEERYEHWKKIAENWERQYNVLKFLYDELIGSPPKREVLKE